MKALNRSQVIAAVQKLGVSVIGPSEDFDGRKGAIWIDGEATYHFDAHGNTPIALEVEHALTGAGWYADFVDSGTVMLYKL